MSERVVSFGVNWGQGMMSGWVGNPIVYMLPNLLGTEELRNPLASSGEKTPCNGGGGHRTGEPSRTFDSEYSFLLNIVIWEM